MRTKTLLLTAALCVAGVASSMAQSNVYSLNIVGYVNIPVLANHFYLIENPLNTTPNNTITNVIQLPDTYDGSIVFTYAAGALTPVETFIAGFGWAPGTTVLNPGQGFYLYPGTNGTVTFTGSVQTNSSIVLSPGFNLVGSPFPASTNLVSLGLHGVDGDLVYRYSTAAASLNDIITFVGGYGWADGNDPTGGPTNGPSLNVAEGFFYYNQNTANTWTQNFIVQ